ncbi:MAG: hypothetical protein Q4D53_07385 [Leptotrichiaceae bacterium]|nr:hypothetical protein [Leptotrichiaceae bacterium]
MKNKSFDNFFYLKDGKIHDIEDVQKEYKNNFGDISKYKGSMFCPECKKAELSFTHKTSSRREFLSKLPTSSHVEGCSYINDYASKKELRKYVKSLTDDQIQDRLESALNSLFNKQNQLNKEIMNSSENNPFVIEHVNINTGVSQRKAIPRKSIKSWFDKAYEGEVYIFYGRVKLEVKEISKKENNKTYYKLIVKTKAKDGSWKEKTSIFRAYIKDDVDIDSIYDIAVFGHIKFYKKFPEINTETLSSIMFRKRKS